MLKFVLCCLFLIYTTNGTDESDIFNPCDQIRTISKEIVKELFRFPPVEQLKRNYQYINCSNRGLRTVPGKLDASVEVLDLGGNVIRNIRQGHFSQLRRLQFLTLSENCVAAPMAPFLQRSRPLCKGKDSLNVDFDKNSNIKWLSLRFNFIKYPPNFPQSLEYLDITATGLGNFSSGFAASLPKLTMLTASANCIKENDFALFCPSGNFSMKSVPASLEYLDLSLNTLDKVQEDLLSTNLHFFLTSFSVIPNLKSGSFSKAQSLKLLELQHISPHGPLIIDADVFYPLPELEFLDLSMNFIQFIPENLFQNNINLKVLVLQFNCLHSYIQEPYFVMFLSSLRVLDVSYSSYCLDHGQRQGAVIQHLLLGPIYTKLISLEELFFGPKRSTYKKEMKLYETHYLSIDANTFLPLRSLPHLRKIGLDYSGITNATHDAWKDLNSLSSIYMSGNSLGLTSSRRKEGKEISSVNQGTLTRFSEIALCIQKQQMHKSLTDQLSNTERVENDFSQNQIFSIQYSSGYFLSDVTVLDLSQNRISWISHGDFKKIPNLTHLSLRWNPVMFVNALAFSQLKYLQVLDLYETATQSNFDMTFATTLQKNLPISFTFSGVGTKLVFLNIYRTGARYHMTRAKINHLNLAGNDINGGEEKQNRNLQLFTGIRELNLSSCYILEFPHNFFKGAEGLVSLDLRHNMLSETPTSATENLTTLVELNLDHNSIKLLGDTMLSNFPRLTTFTVSRNRISYIRPGYFNNSFNLLHLDLSDNFIVSLDSDVLPLNVLSNLKFLDIRRNVFDCACWRWMVFYDWYTSRGRSQTAVPGLFSECSETIDDYYGGCVSCHSPLVYSGRSLMTESYITSCDLHTMAHYCIAFSLLDFIFVIVGVVARSKQFRETLYREAHKQFRKNRMARDSWAETTPLNTDVFLFFDTTNDQVGNWVDAKLLPGMEKKSPKFNFTLIGRDVSCGAGQPRQIAEMAHVCWKTVFLLSCDYGLKGLSQFALKTAEQAEYAQGRRKIVVIYFFDGKTKVSIPKRLERRKFVSNFHHILKFNAEEDNEEMVFEALHTALVC